MGNQKPLFDRQHNGQKNKGQTSTLKLKIEKHELYEILAREPNYFGRGLVAYILNVEYICLSRSDIPDIVVPIMISFIENCCRQCNFGSYNSKVWFTFYFSYMSFFIYVIFFLYRNNWEKWESNRQKVSYFLFSSISMLFELLIMSWFVRSTYRNMNVSFWS